jgi:peptidoglycan/xylan/chitin deacetylase (PgdA/CDA1 family)
VKSVPTLLTPYGFAPPRLYISAVARRRFSAALALCAGLIALPSLINIPSAEAKSANESFIVNRVRTKDPVVFITIDDGSVITDGLVRLLLSKKIPITNFVLSEALKTHWKALHRIQRPGTSFENHSETHRLMSSLSLKEQTSEICRANEHVRGNYKKIPVFFRPPGGSHNSDTVIAAKKCGIKKIVMWNVEADRGKIVRSGGGSIQRGDIILLHYLNSLESSLKVVLAEIKRLGLRPASLRDYLAPQPSPVPTTTTMPQ